MRKLLEDHKKKLLKQLTKKAKKITEDDVKLLLKKVANKKIVIAKLLKVGETIEKKMKLLWPFIKDYSSGKFSDVEWTSISVTVAGFQFLLNPRSLDIEPLPVIDEFDEAIVIGFMLKEIDADLAKYKAWKKSK